MTEGFIQNVQFDLFEDFTQNIQFDLFSVEIVVGVGDLFSVELVIGETATLMLAENYVTIREVFVDGAKVEPNAEKQIFLPRGGDSLWEVGVGDILQPKEDKTFTIKKAHEIDAEAGSTDKYLNEQGNFTNTITTHSEFLGKNAEADYQHIDTTISKQTLVEADKVPIYDSVAGKVVLTNKSNVSSYSAETVSAPANAGILTLKNATETVVSTTLTNSNSFAIALPTAVTGKINESILIFKTGATLPTLTQPTGVVYRTETPAIAINQTWTFCYERVSYDNGSTFEIYVSATKNV